MAWSVFLSVPDVFLASYYRFVSVFQHKFVSGLCFVADGVSDLASPCQTFLFSFCLDTELFSIRPTLQADLRYILFIFVKTMFKWFG